MLSKILKCIPMWVHHKEDILLKKKSKQNIFRHHSAPKYMIQFSWSYLQKPKPTFFNSLFHVPSPFILKS